MCQNDQNFVNIKNIKACAHVQTQKSSTCENDQNFANIKNIKAHAHMCANTKKV